MVIPATTPQGLVYSQGQIPLAMASPLLSPLLQLVSLVLLASAAEGAAITKRSYSDQSVRGYLTERACWWDEICKEEFQTQFRCKCPLGSFCRSPGRYYNAYCTMTGTGYIWTQPDRSWGLTP